MNIVFIWWGCSKWAIGPLYDPAAFKWYLSGTLGECVAIVVIVANYLFPKTEKRIIRRRG